MLRLRAKQKAAVLAILIAIACLLRFIFASSGVLPQQNQQTFSLQEYVLLVQDSDDLRVQALLRHRKGVLFLGELSGSLDVREFFDCKFRAMNTSAESEHSHISAMSRKCRRKVERKERREKDAAFQDCMEKICRTTRVLVGELPTGTFSDTPAINTVLEQAQNLNIKIIHVISDPLKIDLGASDSADIYCRKLLRTIAQGSRIASTGRYLLVDTDALADGGATLKGVLHILDFLRLASDRGLERHVDSLFVSENSYVKGNRMARDIAPSCKNARLALTALATEVNKHLATQTWMREAKP